MVLALLELTTQHLARRILRDHVDELHLTHLFEGSHVLSHVVHDILRRRTARAVRVLQHHEGLGDLLALCILSAHTATVRNGRMMVQHVLQLTRSHLVALVLDKLFGAVDDKHEAIVIDVANVSCSKKSVLSEDILIGLVVAVVRGTLILPLDSVCSVGLRLKALPSLHFGVNASCIYYQLAVLAVAVATTRLEPLAVPGGCPARCSDNRIWKQSSLVTLPFAFYSVSNTIG